MKNYLHWLSPLLWVCLLLLSLLTPQLLQLLRQPQQPLLPLQHRLKPFTKLRTRNTIKRLRKRRLLRNTTKKL